MALTAGTYKARVSGEAVLGSSKNKGTPFIEFYLQIRDGENKGGMVKWTGYFTENTNERSIQALQTCGWKGDDLGEFSDGGLHGLDSNDVDIVVELETYESKEGEQRTRPRVAWINRVSGFLNTDSAMNKAAAASFGDRMRGLVIKVKEKNPVKSTPTASHGGALPVVPNGSNEDDSIPF